MDDLLSALDIVLARMVRGHALTDEQSSSIYYCTREELERQSARQATETAHADADETLPLVPRIGASTPRPRRADGTSGGVV